MNSKVLSYTSSPGLRTISAIKGLLLLYMLLIFSLTFGQNKIKVACIGNSVTAGYGLKNPATDSYPAQLQTLLGTSYLVENFGHSGATLLSKGHHPYIETKEYQKALDFHPDIAVIHLGLNDTDPRNWPNYGLEFQQDYAHLIEEIRKSNPKVQVYITRLTPIFSGHPRFLSGTRDWYRDIQTLIPQIAENNQVELIDINKNLKTRIDLFDDFLHPNKQGAGILAKEVALAIAAIPQKLELNPSFSSHMVLQRDRRNLIFGKARPHEQVKVRFAGKTFTTQVGNDGTWELWLPATKAGGPYLLSIATKEEKIDLEDLLFGDVYLASGQSNMAFPLRSALGGQTLRDEMQKNPLIRLFKAKNLVETHAAAWDSLTLKKVNDLEFFRGAWEVPTSENLDQFSAVAIFFAADLVKTAQVPIGIIDLSVGGSTTESWIQRSDLECDNLLAPYITTWRKSDFMMDFVRERSAQNLQNSTVKHQRHPYEPAYNFEAGISTFLKTNIKAVLWYQGESNAHNVELHHHLFRVLVNSWRSAFHQDLPFYFVQLPGMNRPSWGNFRNSQRLLQKEIPNTHLAVTLDLGEANEVHPKNKIPVGRRLSLLVQKYEYGKSVEADYPEAIAITETQAHFVITFKNAQSLVTPDNSVVKGFQFMDGRGYLHPAQATIQGRNQVLLYKPADKVQKILYGFEPFSPANLYNETGIPASTFDWDLR